MKLGDLIKPKQYALEVLDMFLHKQCDLERTKFAYSQNEVFEAVKMSKEALEELEQYRSLGTVEALKEAREKQIPKKPIDKELTVYGGGTQIIHAYCQICEQPVKIFNGHQNSKEFRRDEDVFCSYCGQKLDWEEGGTSD